MSFYHNVNPGDPFKPSARLENDIRNLLNGLNGFTGGVNSAIGSKMIRVPVYNTTEDAFEPGQALSLDVSGAIVCDAYPATAFDPEAPCFGVCLNAAPSGQVCDCVLCGLAMVEITGGTGEFARPVEGGAFELDDEGLKILNVTGGTNAVVFVGDYERGVKSYVPGAGISISGTTNFAEYAIAANLEPGTAISITDGANGSKVISYTGSGGGSGGIGYPDYVALGTIPSNAPSPSAFSDGIGTTYLLPVHAGVSIKYYSPISDCIALYAPAVSGSSSSMGGTPYMLTNDVAYTPNQDGWVRISIIDDGDHVGACLRVYIGTTDWTKALPLYRCGAFKKPGLSVSVSGNTATLSLLNGTGAVKLIGTGLEVTGNTNNEVFLNVTGSTSGGGSSGGTGTAVFIFGQTAAYAAQPNTDYYIGAALDARETQSNYPNLIYGVSTYEIINGAFVHVDGATWSDIENLDYSKINAHAGDSEQYEGYFDDWMDCYQFKVGILLPTGLTEDCYINLHVGKESHTMVFCQDSTSGILNSDASGEWEEMQFLAVIIGRNVSLFYDHTENVWYATEAT